MDTTYILPKRVFVLYAGVEKVFHDNFILQRNEDETWEKLNLIKIVLDNS